MTETPVARYLALAAFAALVAVPAARGDDTLFARPRLSGSPIPLADIMIGVQLRHVKLWQATKAQNFQLVRFEATLMRESLANAAMLYSHIPIDNVTSATTTLVAATAKDATNLAALFDQLTTACNACHTAAEIPFIEIKTPSSSPFTDQDFAPDDK